MITQVLHCPYCHGMDIVRHGTTSEGKQRYRCRECRLGRGRTFLLEYTYAGPGGDMRNVYGFKYIAAAISLALGITITAFADDPGFPAPTGDPAFVPPGARLERLFDGGCMLTEGVAAGHDGMIYFSDITFTKFCKDPSGKYLQAGNIWQYNPQTGQTTVFRSPSGMANGIKFDREGNMIAALGADYGGRMLVKTDMQTGKSYILTGLFNGRPYNALNDLSIDERSYWIPGSYV